MTLHTLRDCSLQSHPQPSETRASASGKLRINSSGLPHQPPPAPPFPAQGNPQTCLCVKAARSLIYTPHQPLILHKGSLSP